MIAANDDFDIPAAAGIQLCHWFSRRSASGLGLMPNPSTYRVVVSAIDGFK